VRPLEPLFLAAGRCALEAAQRPQTGISSSFSSSYLAENEDDEEDDF